jgi:signal-transduction protein with cAMP-binding, CBS, and nucleotidyltransferase domain
MHHIVKDWMVDLLVFIDPNASVLEALQLMRRRYIHSILVSKTADNPEFGIVTSTDICDRIIAENRNPAKTKVREIMHSPVLSISENKSLEECVLMMKENNIHHLPVVNKNGEMVGFISATDFMVAAEQLSK